jgi:hypothetical protein
MLWLEVKGAAAAFHSLVGRAVTHCQSNLDGVPDLRCLGAPDGGAAEIEAARFDDGSWLVICYEPPTEGYSSWTPGSPGYCSIHIYTRHLV